MPRETFPRLLVRSELPRGTAEVSGTTGLLTPSHGENLAEFSLSCHSLPLWWRKGSREELVLFGMLSCSECLVHSSLYLGSHLQTLNLHTGWDVSVNYQVLYL